MSLARVFGERLRGLLTRRRPEGELDDEVRFHLEMQADDNIRAGMSPDEARRAALRSFGGVEPMKENYRDGWSFAAVESVLQDVRFAARTLRRSPGFAAVSIAVLALAIGANTAMFSVLHTVLLRPLPYQSPEQLMMLWTELPNQQTREGRSTVADVERWRSENRSFDDLAIFDPASVTLGGAEPQQIGVNRVSPNYFSILGVQPLLGRTFTDDEARERQHVAVVSHGFWQSRMAGSPAALGATIELDGNPMRVVGILPAGFPAGDRLVWQPHTLVQGWETRRGGQIWFVMGRLRPGVSANQAQTELTAIARRLDSRNGGVSVVPIAQHQTTPGTRSALWMLTGAVLCVLLIAATNVASLSLARGAGREREIALRTALGAGRWRIIRQLLAEGLTLAAIAGLLGLAVAAAAMRAIQVLKPGNLPRLDKLSLDPQVLAWACGLCLFSGVVAGLAPAITVARQSLRPAGRGIAGGAAVRGIRRALVVTEYALALILLAGAGLLVRSLWSAAHVDPGFPTARMLSIQISAAAYPNAAAKAAFYQRVIDEISPLPGVEAAGIIGDLFIGISPEQDVTLEAGAARLRFRRDEVSPQFFQTLGIQLRRGRSFSTQDGADSPPVAILNEAMARRLWPERDPVGQRFKLGAGPWFTVVGVVGDVRRQGPEHEPLPQMFEPLPQNPSRLSTLLVRTSTDNPLQMAGPVLAAVRRVDRQTPLYGITTLDNRLGAFLTQRRFLAWLLIGFSAAALVMAAIGIYGLIQYSVAARTQEIGVRIALGAQPGEIFRMVIGEGLKLSLTGAGIGLLGALWLGRAGASLLYGVTATDPSTFLAVSLLLTAVSIAACYFPARRAMKLDPMGALRQE